MRELRQHIGLQLNCLPFIGARVLVMADEKTLQHTLDLARADVVRGQANLALGLLRTVQLEIDDLAGTSIWAEYQLIYAGALAGMNDSGTGSAFEETLSRISRLTEPSPELEMRSHGDFGKYLAGKGWRTAARKHYQLAERIAADLEQAEEVARFQMCIILLDLEENDDPRLGSFQNLKQAAKGRYTAREQHAAWIHYDDEIQDGGKQLVAARKGSDASVEYFRGVLSEIRRNRE